MPLFTHPDSNNVHLLLYNELGSRQHRNFSESDMHDGMNVAFFGDSFTDNYYIAAQYSFTEILDYLLNHAVLRDEPSPTNSINVFNFGIGGTGPDKQYINYRKIREKVKLDHVFYVFCGNDIRDIKRNVQFDHVQFDQNIKELIEHIRQPILMRWLSGFHMTYLAMDAWHRLKSASDIQTENLDLDAKLALRDIVLKWRTEVEANGGQFYAVVLPRPATTQRFAEIGWPPSLTTLYLEPHFKVAFPDGRGWQFETDAHWNEAGNMVAADFLYRFLEPRLELPVLGDIALAEARYVYYQAFVQDSDMEDMEGLRWTPSSSWAKPRAFSEQEAAGIRAKYLSLNLDYQQQWLGTWFREREPHARGGGWEIHVHDHHIYYVKVDCGRSDPTARLFLRVLAPNSNARMDLLEEISLGDANERSIWYQGSKCYVKRYLDYWPLAGVQTGEYRENRKLLWEETFTVDPAQTIAKDLAPHRKRYKALAEREPVARSRWNVHVLGREIVYLKDPCHSVDLDGNFVMRVLPAPSVKDSELNRTRDENGFVLSHRHDFRERHGHPKTNTSSMFDGKCILALSLPKFPVTAVKTGQRNIWEVTFNLDIQTSSATKTGVAP